MSTLSIIFITFIIIILTMIAFNKSFSKEIEKIFQIQEMKIDFPNKIMKIIQI